MWPMGIPVLGTFSEGRPTVRRTSTYFQPSHFMPFTPSEERAPQVRVPESRSRILISTAVFLVVHHAKEEVKPHALFTSVVALSL
jgi:hypothetical protein